MLEAWRETGAECKLMVRGLQEELTIGGGTELGRSTEVIVTGGALSSSKKSRLLLKKAFIWRCLWWGW